MRYEKRLEKAIQLTKLIGAGKAFPFGDKLSPLPSSSNLEKTASGFPTKDRGDSRTQALQAQLRAKHMSGEQLDALLNFYQSKVGASILEAQRKVSRDFAKEYRASLRADSTQAGLSSNHSATKVESRNGSSQVKSRDVPACDFCGEKPIDITRLVAGPNLFICDRCIGICCEILKEQGH